MKKFTTSLLIVYMFILGLNKTYGECQLKNGGFEQWETDTLYSILSDAKTSYQYPQNWFTFFDPFLFSFGEDSNFVLRKTTDKYEGSYAVELRADVGKTEILAYKESCHDTPLKLEGYYKSTLSSSDSVVISYGSIINSENVIAYGEKIFTGSPVSNYEKFSVNIEKLNQEVVADSFLIMVSIVNNNGVKPVSFFLDNVSLVYGTTGLNTNLSMEAIKIGPNPCDEYLNVHLNELPENSETTYSVFDIQGKIAVSGSVPAMNGNNFEIFTGNLNKGIYYLVVKSGDIYNTKKFIRQ